MALGKHFLRILFAVLLASVAGCAATTDTPLPKNQDDLKQIHEIYQHFVKSQEKPPGEVSDLTQRQYERIHPGTVKALQDGKYLVVFGITAKDAGTVLAYEKDAPVQGGTVIMADGSVKTVTADEFKAAKR